MPTYVYGPRAGRKQKKNCAVCSAHFEMAQHMSDAALTKCPQCGGEIERIITAPNVNGAGCYQKPSDQRLASAGFTQYKRQGKGHYEKSFGQGPSTLQS